MRGIVLDVEV